jgi:hypothetical protein
MVEVLKEPIALAIIGGLLSMLVLYINNKIKKEKNKQSDYMKTFGLVSVICFIVLQVFSHNANISMDGGSTTPATLLNDKSFDVINGGGINMRGGHPDF